jgi:phytoene synthase
MAEYDPILLFVSRLLPPRVAKDAGALYAWCRRLDEICDQEGADPIETRHQLDEWERRFGELWEGRPVDELDAALTECLLRQRNNENGLTEEPFRDMIEGMRSDTVVGGGRRIASLAELEEYAYQVAGTVGLMLLPLLEAPPEAKEPAISLGKAIQLINILRDASPDVALGRIYLPQDMLRAQDVKEEDILLANDNSNISNGYRSVTKAVCERANELLEEAEVGKESLPGLGPLLVQIIIELYRGYLVELEKRGYNNLTFNGERVKISKFQKVAASLTALKKIYLPPNW